MAEVIAPEGKLDLAAAAGLHSELGALRGQDIELDLSRATQLGALCLQVLIACRNTARDAGTAFHIKGACDKVASNAAQMGMPLHNLTEG